MIDTLGFKNEDRVVIINADDFGLTNASNEAIKKLFQNGAITSSSLMVPCKAAYDAALFCVHDKKSNVGVHLTLTSSENDRHTPVFQDFVLDSLVAEDGCFHSDSRTVEQFAKPEQVMLELRAQIETALGWGVDITHLDSHAGSVLGLFTGRDFLDIVFDLCEQFRLPFHLPKGIVNQPFLRQKQKKSFKKIIASAESRGILLIDDQCGLSYHLSDREEPDCRHWAGSHSDRHPSRHRQRRIDLANAAFFEKRNGI
jgi:predicted glycoside hydrolase/deacetylase ChbG (UPF0249 family)